MIEQEIAIPTKDGAVDTFICHPERGGPFPVILFLMDAPGMREELRDMARRFATVGYYVLLPNLYYRHGAGMVVDTSALTPDSPERARMFQMMDTNGDGFVDAAEIDAMSARRFQRMRRHQRGAAAASPTATPPGICAEIAEEKRQPETDVGLAVTRIDKHQPHDDDQGDERDHERRKDRAKPADFSEHVWHLITSVIWQRLQLTEKRASTPRPCRAIRSAAPPCIRGDLRAIRQRAFERVR